MKTILEYIAEYAADASRADKPALVDVNECLSYSCLFGRIQEYAAKLSRNGVKKGDYVLIRCTQDAACLTAVFAVQYAGAVIVPLEKDAGSVRISEIIADTHAVLYIDNRETDIELKQLMMPGAEDDAAFDLSNAVFPDPEDVSEVLFSTGTTGRSKGIVITHANNIALAENITEGVKMRRDNVELIPMPLSHSHGYRRSLADLYYGNTVIIIGGVMVVNTMFKMMDEYRVTAIDLAPALLSIIFKLSKDRLGDYRDRLDYIQLGSAPLVEEDKQRLRRLLPHTRLYNFYGSTEAGCSCILDFQDDVIRPHCIGKATKNARFIFTDENRNRVEADEEHPAFLATGGAQNMREYFHEPELTAQTMKDGYIYTNDLGYIDHEGYIYCLGRQDDVINFAGVKISPDEIEQEAVKFEGVKDAACVPVADKTYGQVPKLFVSLKEGCEDFSEKDCLESLKGRLDANKVPKYIVVIDEIPRTGNGKIQRKKLIDL
ncbi:MAG: acyl--CoA ligase [Lachnospiraceae bacterium]|nr:acyl--CoA ligase [Lachnospiraceae bacterium]